MSNQTPSAKRNAKRVLLIGWDAADWSFIDPLIDAGLMPTLAKLRAKSTWGNLATLQPALSPMLWTSIATGKRPAKHGVHGFIEPAPDGSGVRPVASTSRKCKAVWNIVNQSGLRSNVIGWYATYPAEPINGVIVSNGIEVPTARLNEPWPMPAGSVHPANLSDEIANLRVHPGELDAHALLPFIPNASKIDRLNDKRLAELGSLLAQSASIHAITTHLMENTQWDFTAVYYEGIDRFGHTFMQYHPPKMEGVNDEEFEIYREVMTGCYRFHDMMLERLLQLAGDETTVILISDHGYFNDHRRPKLSAGPLEWHRPLGIACASGPAIRVDQKLFGATVLDVTPTILSLFGLPAATDMDGRPWAEVLSAHPPDAIESWETVEGDAGLHPADLRIDATSAAAAMQQLVELGYIAAPDENAQLASSQAADIANYNLAIAHLDSGHTLEALPILTDLHARYEDSVSVAIHLALAHASCDHRKEARSIAEKLITQTSPPPRAFLMLGTLDLMEGKPQSALTWLKKVEAADVQTPGLNLRLAQVYLQMKAWPDAKAIMLKEAARSPDSSAARVYLAEAMLELGEVDAALETALRAVDINHHFPRAHYIVGRILSKMNEHERAIQALQVCLKIAANHRPARELLAELYEQTGKLDLAMHQRMILRSANQANA